MLSRLTDTNAAHHAPIKGQFVSVTAVGSIENYDSPVVVKNKKTLPSTSGTIDAAHVSEVTGMKTYEYTNHLGNVLMTTNDKRLPLDSNSDDIIDGYAADVRSWSDYYPYGMPQVGRNTNLSDYRFGFEGYEMDNEVSGNGNSYTTEYRQYDPRLGRWRSHDPITKPYESPYAAFSNNPILYVDPDGRDTLIVHMGGVIAEMSRGRAQIRKVTFSLMQKGVQTKLPYEMYSIQNIDPKYRTELNEETYVLKWQVRDKVRDVPKYKNDIFVAPYGDGVFIHPGNWCGSFHGCIGLSENPPIDDPNNFEPEDLMMTATGPAQDKVRSIYDEVNGGPNGGKLTGSKFILETNSRAPDFLRPMEIMEAKLPQTTHPWTTDQRVDAAVMTMEIGMDVGAEVYGAAKKVGSAIGGAAKAVGQKIGGMFKKAPVQHKSVRFL